MRSTIDWHFNAIYSVSAGVVGLACVAAIVSVAMCRIHMRREMYLQQRATNNMSGYMERNNTGNPIHMGNLDNNSFPVLLPRNVAPIKPPGYSEQDVGAPPPYISTLDLRCESTAEGSEKSLGTTAEATALMVPTEETVVDTVL